MAKAGFMVVVMLNALFLGFEARAENEQQGVSHQNVVELFTSQGCSSCPAADLVLKSFVNRPGIITLSYSVDYWDYLGWKDTFGKAENSKRQRDYAKSRGDMAVYTPQAVVNGVSHMNGAHKALIEKEIKRTDGLLDKQSIQLSATKERQAIRVAFKGKSKPSGKPFVLWMLRVKDVATVKVKRGENYGRDLTYHNIVLGAQKVATVDLTKESIKIKQPKALKSDEHHVFLLQVGLTGPIVGATKL